MSHSKIIELRKFGKQASGNDFDNNNDLATQQECIRLLRAFTQIANPGIPQPSFRRRKRPHPTPNKRGEKPTTDISFLA